MPNWCQNVIYVSHEDKNKMMALKDAIINHELCDYIKPMPEELKDTTAPDDSPNWYDWAVGNWGTNWDIYSPHDTDEIYSDVDGETYVFKFDTAWAPPIPVYEEMEKQGFQLLARYVEYGMGYFGHYSDGSDICGELTDDVMVRDEHLQSEYA